MKVGIGTIISEGLDPAIAAKQFAAAIAKLPKETPQPGPAGGTSRADGSPDRRGDVPPAPPPVRPDNEA
jgi:hypothetical protein